MLRDTSFSALAKIVEAVEWWRRKKHHPPLVVTVQELKDSADVFSIEFIDMKQRYRVLYGEDVLRDLQVPMQLHRRQLEYELREKLILLRQHLLLAAEKESRLWDILLRSAPSFSTLFRHARIALGDASPPTRREAAKAFNASGVIQVLDVREEKIDRKKVDIRELVARYLDEVEQVTTLVDQALDRNASGRNK